MPNRKHLVERRGICSRPRGKHCRTDARKIRRCVQLSCTRAKKRDGSSCDMDAAALRCDSRDGTNALVPK